MAQKNKKQKKERDLIELLDVFFEQKSQLFFKLSMGITLLFGLLLFEPKVSVGGDDAAYLIRAFYFFSEFRFPSFQGPLYPMVISPIVGLWGFSLIPVKLLSLVFLTLHLYFFYKTFKNRIPNSILFPTLLIISIAPDFLYFGSQTYSEAFFLFLQSAFTYYFFTHIIDNTQTDLKALIKKSVAAAGLIMLMALTRSVGYGMLIVAVLFLLYFKEWKKAGLFIASFVIILALWSGTKILLWPEASAQIAEQGTTLIYKNAYDKSKGKEDFSGYLQRIVDNSDIYLSKRMYQFWGFRDEITDPIRALTIFSYLWLFAAAFLVFKQNKYLLFSALYLIVMIGITFIILQKIWDSARLVIIYFPLFNIMAFSLVYYAGKFPKTKILQILVPVLAIALTFSTFSATTLKVKKQQKVVSEYLSGNKLEGLTPDWQNYVLMTQWASKSIPSDKVIACRKPNIAFINSNRKYFGLYKVPSKDPDEVLEFFRKYKIEYIIMASLRKYEQQKTKFTINTVQRTLYYLQQKYPQRIKLVHQIGTDEQAMLFYIELK